MASWLNKEYYVCEKDMLRFHKTKVGTNRNPNKLNLFSTNNAMSVWNPNLFFIKWDWNKKTKRSPYILHYDEKSMLFAVCCRKEFNSAQLSSEFNSAQKLCSESDRMFALAALLLNRLSLYALQTNFHTSKGILNWTSLSRSPLAWTGSERNSSKSGCLWLCSWSHTCFNIFTNNHKTELVFVWTTSQLRREIR